MGEDAVGSVCLLLRLKRAISSTLERPRPPLIRVLHEELHRRAADRAAPLERAVHASRNRHVGAEVHFPNSRASRFAAQSIVLPGHHRGSIIIAPGGKRWRIQTRNGSEELVELVRRRGISRPRCSRGCSSPEASRWPYGRVSQNILPFTVDGLGQMKLFVKEHDLASGEGPFGRVRRSGVRILEIGFAPDSRACKRGPAFLYYSLAWGLNSAVECYPHTIEVVGSNPTVPTISIPGKHNEANGLSSAIAPGGSVQEPFAFPYFLSFA